MSAATRGKILWVDDFIEKLQPFVEDMRERGFDVATARDHLEAMERLESFEPRVVLVDIAMPAPDGIEIIQQMHSAHPEKVYAVVSSFLYLQRNVDRLDALPFEVARIDKKFSNVEDPKYEKRFVIPVTELVQSGIGDEVAPRPQIEAQAGGPSPFDTTYDDFDDLSIGERLAMQARAAELAKDTLRTAWARGYAWVLLCGDKNNFSMFAEKFEDVPSDEQITERAELLNRAPFPFSRPAEGDDVCAATGNGWAVCESNEQMDGYPTVTIRLDGHEMVWHFDTGCAISLYSYEELRSKDLVPDAENFSLEQRAGFSEPYYFWAKLERDAILQSQNGDDTQSVKLKGKMILEWDQGPFARRCSSPNCPFGEDQHSPGQNCPGRKALIGRDLLTTNGIAIVLNGASRVTYLEKEKKGRRPV